MIIKKPISELLLILVKQHSSCFSCCIKTSRCFFFIRVTNKELLSLDRMEA